MKKNSNTYFVTNPEFGFETAGVTVSAVYHPSPAGSVLKPVYMIEINVEPGRPVKLDEFVAAVSRVFAREPALGEVCAWMHEVGDDPADDVLVVNVAFEPDGFSFERLEACAAELVAGLGFGAW